MSSPHSRLARGSSLTGTVSNHSLQKGRGVAKYQALFLGSHKLLLSGCLLCLRDTTQSRLHIILPCIKTQPGAPGLQMRWTHVSSQKGGGGTHRGEPSVWEHCIPACWHYRVEHETFSKWLGGLNFCNTFSLGSGRKDLLTAAPNELCSLQPQPTPRGLAVLFNTTPKSHMHLRSTCTTTAQPC